MEDMNGLERQLANVVQGALRPPRSVDVTSIVHTATSGTPSGRRSAISRWFGGGTSVPKGRGSSLFSALKFVAAAAIVVLFGSFLLTGVITTQQDEVLPAAVTASLSPVPSVTGVPTESARPTVRTDILPGVALTVEQVDSGVFRILGDGVRDLSAIEVGTLWNIDTPDGNIWGWANDIPGREGDRLVRLGSDLSIEPPRSGRRVVRVTPDGTVWAMGVEAAGKTSSKTRKSHLVVHSFDGSEWTRRLRVKGPAGGPPRGALAVAADGAVWASWHTTPASGTTDGMVDVVVARLEQDRWQPLEAPIKSSAKGQVELFVTGTDDVWLVTQRPGTAWLNRYVAGEWQRLGPEPWEGGQIGQDGTVWARHSGWQDRGLRRFDGTHWQDFDFLLEDSDSAPPWPLEGWRGFNVGPDGSLWLPSSMGSPDTGVGCDGINRFDGSTWERFLVDQCFYQVSFSSDGDVWLLAGDPDLPSIEQDQSPQGLYVITSGVVAASE